MWYKDRSDLGYYRLLITKGYEQLVLSVRGAKKIATVDRFDQLIENVTQDESSPDRKEIRERLNIKNAHISYAPRFFVDIQSGMGPFHFWQLCIAQTRKDTDCVRLACPKLLQCCLSVSTTEAT